MSLSELLKKASPKLEHCWHDRPEPTNLEGSQYSFCCFCGKARSRKRVVPGHGIHHPPATCNWTWAPWKLYPHYGPDEAHCDPKYR